MSVPTQSNHDDDPVAARGFERVRPQELEAEQCVLGGMLLSTDAIDDVTEVLRGPAGAHDFYRPAHQTIYSHILALYAQGEPVDPITLKAALLSSGDLDRAGGPGYLHQLVEVVPTAATAAAYAQIVADAAVDRRLIEAGTRIIQSGYTRDGDVEDRVQDAEREVYSVAQRRVEDTLTHVTDGIADTIDDIEAAGRRKPGELTGVPTGFTDLDSLTEGLQPGQLIIIAARPSVGKSTLALDWARGCSIKHGRPAVFFSLEMGRKELQQRLLSAEGSVPLHHIRSGKVDEEGWKRLARAKTKIDASPLFLDDSPELNALVIRTKARRLKQRQGLDLVIVDYLQLMQHGGSRRVESRQQEVSDMSRQMKLMAKELQVPVVAISQLNRNPEQRTDKKPQTSDLRESGALEQDADMIVLLHREDVYERESSRAGEADMIVSKHRNGPTATITTAFQGHYSRFVDMATGL
ncbi:replicative DNA helicase [Streptomyces sp. RKND-216]|uniref:replicative DNA helicase n=1 Tax=Streptomyces sp. RKND-216 TaxID=2562581 RepID=UPI00109E19D9|nr:replicative DNA helicase [Streptomyces sp. RKND-216]THA28242.1 replicative DNA helicase [Streptomyces sp. RKND-216]